MNMSEHVDILYLWVEDSSQYHRAVHVTVQLDIITSSTVNYT